MALLAMVDRESMSNASLVDHNVTTHHYKTELRCIPPKSDDYEDYNSTIVTYGPKYAWTPAQTNLILEVFMWTYVLFQIPNGRLAELVSGKWILALSVIGSTLMSLLSPWAASVNVYLLALARAIMGCCQSAVFPASYVLYNSWLPPEERAQGLALLGTGAYLGAILASYTTGYFLEQPELGWPFAFYMPAVIGIVWTILWLILGSSKPQDNRFISLKELEYIDANLVAKQNTSTKRRSPDWIKMLTSKQVVAFCITSFSMGWVSALSLFLLPSYLNYILLVHPYTNGIVNSVIFVIFAAGSPFAGWLSTVMIRRKTFGMNSLQVRKFFQISATLGQAVGFLLILLAGCRVSLVVAILYIQILLYSFSSGGQVQLPSEISGEFMGSVFAIGNCLSSCASSIALRTFSMIVDDLDSRSQWSTYFYVGAAVATFGSVVFLLYGGNARENFARQAKPAALDKGNKSNKSSIDRESAAQQVEEKFDGC